jgi:hypothetical protein
VLARYEEVVADGDITLCLPSKHVFVAVFGQSYRTFTLLANKHSPAVAFIVGL